MKKILYPFILLLIFLGSFAFNIPDYESLGKDPLILKVEPDYLIPGQTVKVYGENFFSFPRNANRLEINNKSIRIISATSDLIEFIVPKLPLGKAQIKLFTSYLGHKSKETIFPPDDFIFVTFPGPEINDVSNISIKPNDIVLFNGRFDKKLKLFFKQADLDIEAEILSDTTCSVKLPSDLPPGPFKIKAFYTKEDLQQNIFNSVVTHELILFNTTHEPTFIKIRPAKAYFDSLTDEEIPFIVELFFNSLRKADVTEYSEIIFEDNGVIDLNTQSKTFKIKNPGSAHITAKYLWEPTSLTLEDKITVIVDLPLKPQYNEVVIDEVFPFASGLFPLTDANMDNFARSNDDFIELHNLTEKKLDLTDCKIYANEKPEPLFIFMITIEPFSYLVFFATNNDSDLPISASVLEFICNEKTIDYISYPAGKNGDPSWQRLPNLSGFQKHPAALFSPGSPPPVVAEPIMEELPPVPVLGIDLSSSGSINNDASIPPPAILKAMDLVINEILSAPTVDVNGDGIFNSGDDEFVEIVNVSGSDLDISGLTLSDKTKIRHIIPAGTILQNLQPLVIFGSTASTNSLGLNNSGAEQVTITTTDGIVIDEISFDNSNLSGISLNRTPDLSFNVLNPHDKFLKSTGKYSPGTRIDGSLFSTPPQDGLDILKGSSSSGG